MAESINRREFLPAASAAASAVAWAGIRGTALRGEDRAPRKSANETINLAVIGCGGRGGGAARDSLNINENVRLVAAADLYGAKCEAMVRALAGQYGDRVAVQSDKIFAGLDAYRRVCEDPDVDLVLLTASPGFRPPHLEAAVQAGKHVFAEKPTCVDPAGYRTCLAAHEAAEKNQTAIVTGTQYRRQTNYVAAVDQVRAGAIGQIVSATSRYCSSGIWYRKRRAGMSDAEYQLNNWMHFTWLSGDQICEQAVHNLDVINWVMGAPPVSAYGSGGRFTRPPDSQMWDSFSIDYLYPGDRLLSFMCRQIPGTESANGSVIRGTEGTLHVAGVSGGSKIFDRSGKQVWSAAGRIRQAYEQEHKDLVDSIRAGKPIVELRQTADSSLTAVLGRLAAYTGQRVTWDFVSNQSTLDLFPADLKMDGTLPLDAYAVPGQTELV